ncbi:NADH dehydrogenase [Tripterygium wilfordii]|uniref:NADH dehydrogenase n=1 Tax=Tripterygium wilfordii TaxID=458696 RepID=A0A7J7DJ59_TRIWF|nr:NADH dehydrogenase [ubiquinone] 1 alpha subcomplex subunit 2-like [Tripterygium wilfordii]KAF5746343.1 NADH dehydrogenase [Tripterygium wilfordii]
MAWRAQLSRNLKELRILFCPSSPESSLTREFIERNYKDLKTLNPKLPILIRECKGIEPQLWARFDMGVERGICLKGIVEQPHIEKAMEELVKIGGALKRSS